jgi:5'-nucleotidase
MAKASPNLPPVTIPPERRIYCNRTLNLRSIRAVGYDLDYTLVHYRVAEWEKRAYEALKERLLAAGWPIRDLSFEPERVCRGLIVDREKGNLIKSNRFGFVKQAMHGMRMLDFETQRQAYSRTIVDLSEKRWVFLNTLFSLSEGCMYAQLVDLLDGKKIPEVLGYGDLYDRVRSTLDEAHMEGTLKDAILANPERFIVLEPEVALTLLDQSRAGKKLLLITNSEWGYTKTLMSYAFDRFLPRGTSWRELFDLIVVSARKPSFFTTPGPFFEIATEDGLLRPSIGQLRKGTAYLGGCAQDIEKFLGLDGEEILYVGDHMFGDVHVTKNVLRWRTALILRELEEEVLAIEAFRPKERALSTLMLEKEKLEASHCRLRLEHQRLREAYGDKPTGKPEPELTGSLERLRERIRALDDRIAPLVRESRVLGNPLWGPLMRAGNDKRDRKSVV